MSPPPTEQLSSVEQARWFTEEVQPHELALRRWLRSQFPRLSDVDDVVHESYVNLLRRRPLGRIAFSKAYLFAAARHAALKVFRKQRLFSEVPLARLSDCQLLDTAANVEEIVMGQQEDDLVAEAVARLPERCREIVKLRAGLGLSYAEIAERLDLSEATVRVQVARGIKKCALFLRERGVRRGAE